jgi:hypothetical protein
MPTCPITAMAKKAKMKRRRKPPRRDSSLGCISGLRGGWRSILLMLGERAKTSRHMSAPPSHRDLLNAAGPGPGDRAGRAEAGAGGDRAARGRSRFDGEVSSGSIPRLRTGPRHSTRQGVGAGGPDGGFESTVVAIANPGRTAVMFATACRTSDDVEPLAKLIDAACRGLSDGDLDLAQVLLEPHEHDLARAYRLGGFEDLARLSYLERPLRTRPGRPSPRDRMARRRRGPALRPGDHARCDVPRPRSQLSGHA